MGYEEDFVRFLQTMISDVEKRIRRGHQRLALNSAQGMVWFQLNVFYFVLFVLMVILKILITFFVVHLNGIIEKSRLEKYPKVWQFILRNHIQQASCLLSLNSLNYSMVRQDVVKSQWFLLVFLTKVKRMERPHPFIHHPDPKDFTGVQVNGSNSSTAREEKINILTEKINELVKKVS